jgi:hypothetical protein
MVSARCNNRRQSKTTVPDQKYSGVKVMAIVGSFFWKVSAMVEGSGRLNLRQESLDALSQPLPSSALFTVMGIRSLDFYCFLLTTTIYSSLLSFLSI